MTQRTTEFYVPGHSYVSRGEALRVMIAAIYNVARDLRTFTTDDVFKRVEGYDAEALRKATAPSKLVSVALRKARSNGMCEPTVSDVKAGDQLAHKRQKRVWVSKIVRPQLPSDYSI